MKILILSAQSVLGRAVTGELASDHELRLLETEPIEGPPGTQVMIGDPLRAETLPAALAGVDAVIHNGELPADAAGRRCRQARLVHARHL